MLTIKGKPVLVWVISGALAFFAIVPVIFFAFSIEYIKTQVSLPELIKAVIFILFFAVYSAALFRLKKYVVYIHLLLIPIEVFDRFAFTVPAEIVAGFNKNTIAGDSFFYLCWIALGFYLWFLRKRKILH